MKDEKVTMNFSEALIELKKGRKIRRLSWAENQSLYFTNNLTIRVMNDISKSSEYWLPLQVDIVSEDWIVID